MKRNTIDASRELRLWIGQVIIPAAMVGLTIYTNSTARCWVADKANAVKAKIQNSLNR